MTATVVCIVVLLATVAILGYQLWKSEGHREQLLNQVSALRAEMIERTETMEHLRAELAGRRRSDMLGQLLGRDQK